MRSLPALVLFALLFQSCAGSSGGSARGERAADEAAREAEDRRFENWRQQLEAARPEEPFETLALTALAAPERCGQGPYRVEVSALSTRFAELFEAYACSPRRLEGVARLTIERPGREPRPSERRFGASADNDACVARAAERGDDRAASASGATAPGASAAAAPGGPGASAPSDAAPVLLERLPEAPEACEREVTLYSIRWGTRGDQVVFDPGTRLVLEFWSAEPNDLEGVSFVIRQKGTPADMTHEAFLAYEEARHAYFDRLHEFNEARVAAGRARWAEPSERPEPPPPPPPPRQERRPPRPSEHAEWIGGYWHHEAGAFHWIAGFWRVPERDVREEKTVSAPEAPPEAPPEREERPPRPSERAVWVPGSWQWDGRAYVWIEGVWRIPPSAGHAWQPSRWIPSRGGVRLVPGGWKLEVRAR